MVRDILNNSLSCRNPFERDLLPWTIVQRKSSFLKTKTKQQTNKKGISYKNIVCILPITLWREEQDQPLFYQYTRTNRNSIWWMLGILEMLHCIASDSLINSQNVKLTCVWCILIQDWSVKDLCTCLCSSFRVVQSASAAVPGKVKDRAMSVQD